MKKGTVLIVIFLFLVYTASPASVFEIEETEKISLGAQAQDPDNDELLYGYTEPLNASGEWQTNYGDAGTYNPSIIVSDGEQTTSQTITIIVRKKQIGPTILSIEPSETTVNTDEGKSLVFRAKAEDQNKDTLQYSWSLDDRILSSGQEFTYEPAYDSAGEHAIALSISDGTEDIEQRWIVTVYDVDLDSLFESIRDTTAAETDIVSLQIPDFESYGLTYTISDPLGNDNLWQTDYDDAAGYEVTVFARGLGYLRQKTVIITIADKDRPPRLVAPDAVWVEEGALMQIPLQASDPDDDTITFSADGLPEGAYFEGNTLVWSPDANTVMKSDALDSLLDKFRILSKTRQVRVVAQSKDLSSEKNIKIIVQDVNQPFSIDPIDPIHVKEGEEIIIDPKYSDPDNDALAFEYSGFMSLSRKVTSFEDAGHHVVKVKASDGFYEQIFFVDVIVDNVNRAPQFKQPSTTLAAEGSSVRVKLDAPDPDDEEVVFSSPDLAPGSYIRGNELVFSPNHDLVSEDREVEYSVVASDGSDETTQKIRFKITNVNQKPIIDETSNTQVAFLGDTALFEINATDPDGDELTYTWQFGLLDSYVGENAHARQFSSEGEKEVSVIVSDGKESITKTWHVRVV